MSIEGANIPDDIMRSAKAAVERMPARSPWVHEVVNEIAKAVLDERERCINICAAEREMGNPVRDAQERIERGEQPLQIEGWNCPYSED